MTPTVFMDPGHAPTDAEIAASLGPAARFWDALTTQLAGAYGIEPTLVPPSRNYGWDLKYRKGGQTLVSLTPWIGASVVATVDYEEGPDGQTTYSATKIQVTPPKKKGW